MKVSCYTKTNVILSVLSSKVHCEACCGGTKSRKPCFHEQICKFNATFMANKHSGGLTTALKSSYAKALKYLLTLCMQVSRLRIMSMLQ